MQDLRALIDQEEMESRMHAARERAQWELGDPSWAEVIVGAFLDPVEDLDQLNDERS